MKSVDYLIVGCGLAGIALSEILFEQGHSFLVYDNNSQQSSSVAAGMYNPVILKRFTPVWRAMEQLQLVKPFYERLETKLNLKLDYLFPLLRRFASIEEQNLWFSAADKPALEPFMSLDVVSYNNEGVDAPHNYGEVLHAGRVHTELLVRSYRDYLSKQDLLVKDSFNYENIQFKSDALYYNGRPIKNIVFAEGFGLKDNPFFNHLPLGGTKGEVLTLKIPGLDLQWPIKSSVFVIPLGDDLYRVGATYNHKDKSHAPSEEGKQELLEKLSRFIKLPFSVVDHRAGVRPTVKDRRPLVGKHPEFNNMYVLNGMGSRGVMIAPYAAKQLYDFIEFNTDIDPEMDLSRFS